MLAKVYVWKGKINSAKIQSDVNLGLKCTIRPCCEKLDYDNSIFLIVCQKILSTQSFLQKVNIYLLSCLSSLRKNTLGTYAHAR